MPTVSELFENEELKTKDALEQLRQIPGPGISVEEQVRLRGILNTAWKKLQDPPADAAKEDVKKWKQRRGYRLERIVFELLWLELLDPAPSYYNNRGYSGGQEEVDEADDVDDLDATDEVDEVDTPSSVKRRGRPSGGEQIDGFFELDNRHFLLEAKWTGGKLPASQIYEFRGKVDGKLAGTIGAIVSIRGFAKGAEYALMWGKELNIILIDGSDLGAALEPGCSFREMIRVKLREAARIGQVYYSYRTFLDLNGRGS